MNDPFALQRDSPIRCGDSDPRLGTSSLQIFAGEDFHGKIYTEVDKYYLTYFLATERKRFQQEQMRNWSIEQQKIKRDSKKSEDEANNYYQTLRKMEDDRWNEVDRLYNEAKYAQNKAQSKYNLNLALCRAKNKVEEKAKDETDKITEIMNNVNGDLLTENPAQAISYGPRKVIPDRWKGLQYEQRASIKYDLLNQIQEKQLAYDEKDNYDKSWAAVTLRNVSEGLLRERENERLEVEEKRKLAEENWQLAKEQNSRREFLDQCVYKNPIGPEYFKNFNTTTR